MSHLQLEVRVAKSPELAARSIEHATHTLSAGDRSAAMQAYRVAVQAHLKHPVSWSNLAALGIALGDIEGAGQHARRALQLDAKNSDAWVNFGVASWHAGRRRDAAQAMERALTRSPGLEAAGLNLSRMLRSLPDNARAAAVLATALQDNPGSWRLSLAMTEVCRLLGDTAAARVHALSALSALLPTLRPMHGPDDGVEPESEEAQRKLLQTMTETCDRLQAGGIAYHLVGGVVLGIVRQGKPFPGDKDVDIGLPFDTDRAYVSALFATGFTPLPVPEPEAARRWCLGFTHDATGVGVDLFFKQAVDGKLRICLGWPDDLIFDLPQYAIGSLKWQGRDWPVPTPVDDYLVADYGMDWRSPVREFDGHRFDKRWYDSQLSCPALALDSIRVHSTWACCGCL